MSKVTDYLAGQFCCFSNQECSNCLYTPRLCPDAYDWADEVIGELRELGIVIPEEGL